MALKLDNFLSNIDTPLYSQKAIPLHNVRTATAKAHRERYPAATCLAILCLKADSTTYKNYRTVFDGSNHGDESPPLARYRTYRSISQVMHVFERGQEQLRHARKLFVGTWEVFCVQFLSSKKAGACSHPYGGEAGKKFQSKCEIMETDLLCFAVSES